MWLRKGRFPVFLKRPLCGTGNYQAYRTETSFLSKANGRKDVLKSKYVDSNKRFGKKEQING